jgi:polyisoprenoid-binding protein YceI
MMRARMQRHPWRGRAAQAAALLGLGLALVPLGAAAQPVAYALVPEQSFVTFEVLHFGTSTIRGRFGPLQGAVTLDRRAGTGEVSLRVPTADVNTGVGVFNARLRQADLLASEAFPEAFFVATNVRFAGSAVAEVRGEFTWRGVSQPLALRAQRFGCRIDAQSSPAAEICGGDFEGELLRSDFGATFGLPFVADRVRLVVQVEGRRRP